MLKILKASAGSGKTYNLAREYIRLVVGSDRPDAYRHVLAVTFTNKATDEMKRRILKELFLLSTAPQNSPYLKDLVPAAQPSVDALQKRAAQQLSLILNDYSAFAVSTIDRFFQQTLRAFSREIGQFASYQVQLDRDTLITESVDRVLDALSDQDETLLDWLTRSARKNLKDKGKMKLEDDLLEMAKGLSQIPEGELCYGREAMERLRVCCEQIIQTYTEQVRAASQAVLDAFDRVGLQPEDTFRHFMCAVRKGLDTPVSPTAEFVQRADNPDQWFSQSNKHLLPMLEPVLAAPLKTYLALFGQPFKEYNTAKILSGQLYSLGVARELRDAFTQLQKEKNVLSLDDSNTLLHKIIDAAPTPFIYEKMGVRFEDFLLDEFQDTSDIQWDNFRPLVHGSIDSGHDSLVVGDVKQSIYRWRGSDWRLLGDRLETEFRKPEVTTLDSNYRTCREIVQFNNAFFTQASRQLDEQMGTSLIQKMYKDVAQTARLREDAPGSVEVVFTEDQLQEIFTTLDELRSRGAAWSDIAILVRANADGALVARELISRACPVVSDDSLKVKSSLVVRRLVSQLSLVDSAPAEGTLEVAGYLARSMAVNIPLNYHSLPELAESILRDMKKADPDTFEAEIPFVLFFLDYLREWTETGGNQLGAFLRSWEAADPCIASPPSGDSIRIMTIHKAKGLEFPFVIIPFAEKVKLYKSSTTWARPRVEGSALVEEAKGLFRVNLNADTQNTFFDGAYLLEQQMQAVDAINIFYVALTRPQYGLKLIAAPPAAGDKKTNMADFLYAFTGSMAYKQGEPFDFSTLKREVREDEGVHLGFESYPSDSGSRLRLSPEAADYFGEGGSTGVLASSRIRGNVLHAILGSVIVPEDLQDAIEGAILRGDLPLALKAETISFLGQRLDAVRDREWFSPQVRVRCEASILSPGALEHRPDRVVMHPDGRVDIVDYKFGQDQQKYRYQVREYVNLYRKMGYEKVAGFLWYLEDNLIIFVD